MYKILLTYFSFVVACVVVIVAFITATTYIQLAVAILLYPLLVFFTYRVFQRKTPRPSKKPGTVMQESPDQPVTLFEKVKEVKIDHVGISDIDKRVFLKLIGSAGIFLFLFSLFNKKAEGLFFKNLPGSVSGKISLENSTGNKIDPAESQPTDGYSISELDDNIISFYGFTNKDGAWYVLRVDTSTGSFRYCRGDNNFPDNWGSRENLNYDYYNNVF